MQKDHDMIIMLFILSRKLTLSEREEHRLWNGKEYVNLPEGDHSEMQWKKMQTKQTHDAGLATLLGFKGKFPLTNCGACQDVPQIKLARMHHFEPCGKSWRALKCGACKRQSMSQYIMGLII